ncbi:hypothetical protein HUG15_14730 [Salicibibacter cibarius]|uniref:Uncharacterized protein n=1 Tax=Salicibibacter cibarius TaxID=2743000 RepID=A0A7T6Z4G5_9BACI|nr:hypothetical protein [Salicibibacter cibarius]QQK76696.1 hypothetical protein HUG15_14730 [Salicibibacter cibarius]
MNTKEAINIVSLLADGISPETGEVFPEDSPYQNPETIRALFVAIKGLERLDRYEARSRQLPENAGKAWTQKEDKDLTLALDAGTSIPDLASIHQRTVGSSEPLQLNQRFCWSIPYLKYSSISRIVTPFGKTYARFRLMNEDKFRNVLIRSIETFVYNANLVISNKDFKRRIFYMSNVFST